METLLLLLFFLKIGDWTYSTVSIYLINLIKGKEPALTHLPYSIIQGQT